MTSPFELSFRCDVPWDSMQELTPGRRHCGSCRREVVDVSALTRKAALRLLDVQPNTCISYLSGADGAPIFRRPKTSPGLAAVASMLLAACSTEEPGDSCALGPEPDEIAELEIAPPEESLLEADSRSFGGPIAVTGAPDRAPPLVTQSVATQSEPVVDHAEPGDPNDVDGVSPRRRPRHSRPPHVVPPVIHTRTAGVPVRFPPPVPSSGVGGS